MLYPFQKEGVEYLRTRKTALLADEMGLGKTVQLLSAIGEKQAVLIIVPAFLKYTWEMHAQQIQPLYRIYTIPSPKDFRAPQVGEIAICSYAALPPTCTGIPNLLIFDEAHYLKNAKAKRHKIAREWCRTVLQRGGCVWFSTGTPLMNKPPDLWNLFALLQWNREIFGDYQNFLRSFSAYWNGKFTVWGKINESIAQKISMKILRRRKKDVLPQLPSKSYSLHIVDIGDPAILKQCEEICGKMGEMEWELLQKNELLFSEISKVYKAVADAKIAATHAFAELWEENEDKPLVIFSAHQNPVQTFAQRKGWKIITGGTPMRERESIVRQFQEGALKGVAATIQAAGVGLTLTRSDTILFTDLTFSPALNAQAEDRIHRIGQERACLIYHMVARHKFDIVMHRLLHRKKEMESALWR